MFIKIDKKDLCNLRTTLRKKEKKKVLDIRLFDRAVNYCIMQYLSTSISKNVNIDKPQDVINILNANN